MDEEKKLILNPFMCIAPMKFFLLEAQLFLI